MLYFDFNGLKFRKAENALETYTSAHTGNLLRKTTLGVVVPSRDSDRMTSAINGQIINSVDDEEKTAKWKIGNNSCSFTAEQNTLYRYTVELEEIEELNIQVLVVNGQDLKPYKYSEEIDNGVMIHAKVLLSKEDTKKLKETIGGSQYFRAIRQGISEEPLEMRFGRCLWSKHEDGIKHDLLLVEKRCDDTTSRPSSLPELYPMQAGIVKNKQHLNNLLELLRRKGILTGDEFEGIRKMDKTQVVDDIEEFYEVDDVDEY
jgi:hypothetical protein